MIASIRLQDIRLLIGFSRQLGAFKIVMRIPYVIDNQTHKLSDVLNAILQEYAHHSLDIATAYFNIGGYRLLREQLANVRDFRRLLGFESQGGADVGP